MKLEGKAHFFTLGSGKKKKKESFSIENQDEAPCMEKDSVRVCFETRPTFFPTCQTQNFKQRCIKCCTKKKCLIYSIFLLIILYTLKH